MKIPIFPGKYHKNGGFSMAMLVYGSVVMIVINTLPPIMGKKLEMMEMASPKTSSVYNRIIFQFHDYGRKVHQFSIALLSHCMCRKADLSAILSVVLVARNAFVVQEGPKEKYIINKALTREHGGLYSLMAGVLSWGWLGSLKLPW